MLYHYLDSDYLNVFFFFFSSRRRHTRSLRDWSSDVCSAERAVRGALGAGVGVAQRLRRAVGRGDGVDTPAAVAVTAGLEIVTGVEPVRDRRQLADDRRAVGAAAHAGRRERLLVGQRPLRGRVPALRRGV